MDISTGTILFRFVLVFIAASLFGLQRQKAHKPIGFGTYIFVAIGACAAALVASEFTPDNPLPTLSAIMTGIGFLGAGALIKTSDKVLGFTSAATVWLFAVLGFIIGVGKYWIGASIFILIWLIMAIDHYLEKKGIGAYQRKLIVTTCKLLPEKEVNKDLMFYTKKHKLIAVEIDKKNSKMVLTYIIEGTKTEMNHLPDKLYDKPWFEGAKIE
ncbi:MAG: MgtC/SapB family protein [Candidatus Nanoarchaeia archaeon]